jgi:hypothetical protein
MGFCIAVAVIVLTGPSMVPDPNRVSNRLVTVVSNRVSNNPITHGTLIWEVEVLRVEVEIEAELGHELRPNRGCCLNNHPIRVVQTSPTPATTSTPTWCPIWTVFAAEVGA